jgi:hypothetical protein
MTSTSTSASITHDFKPAQWLANFECVGGGYTLTECRLALMYQIEGRSPDDQRRACQLISELDDDYRASLIAHLCQRARQGEV